jgi:hypothetical protein
VPAPSVAPESRGCNAGIGGVADCFYRVGQSAVQMQVVNAGPTQWRVAHVTVLT